MFPQAVHTYVQYQLLAQTLIWRRSSFWERVSAFPIIYPCRLAFLPLCTLPRAQGQRALRARLGICVCQHYLGSPAQQLDRCVQGKLLSPQNPIFGTHKDSRSLNRPKGPWAGCPLCPAQ